MSVIIKSTHITGNTNLPVYSLDPLLDDNTKLLFDARRITGSTPLGDDSDLTDLSTFGNLRTDGTSFAFDTSDPAYITLTSSREIELVDGDPGNTDSDFGIAGSTKGVLLVFWIKWHTLASSGFALDMLGDDVGNTYQDALFLMNQAGSSVTAAIGGQVMSTWSPTAGNWYQVAMWCKPGSGVEPRMYVNNVLHSDGPSAITSWNTVSSKSLPGDWKFDGFDTTDVGRVLLQTEETAGTLDQDDAEAVIANDWNTFSPKYGL